MPTSKSNFAESSGDDEVLLDRHIGSTLLTNFYRTIKFKKLNSNIIINNNIEISNEIISHTKHNSQSIPLPQLLYRGTRDGFKGIDFHSRCDNQGPTLTIIKSEHNQVFGGFTTKSWKSSTNGGEYISDDSAFIFKIENSSNQQRQLFRKFNIKQGIMNRYAILDYKDYLPTFGGGCDFCIPSDNLSNTSFSNFGFTYELPPPPTNNDDEYQFGSEQVKSYLAGSEEFKVLEIEVFKIITITTTIQ